MSAPFRLAFLGIDHPHGAHWREMLRNFEDRIEIVAFMTGFGGQTASLEERYSNVPRFETVKALIDGAQFDGAFVCLPNDVGPPAMVQLAAAGKHILSEKPVAGSAADARSIADAVETAGVVMQNGYMWRYDPGAERLREMVCDGRFGKLISVEMNAVTSDVIRRRPDHYLFDAQVSTGGYFSWLACHQLDLMFYITQQKVVGVTARTGVFGDTPTEVEDGGVAILDLEGGGIATFSGGYWIPRWAGENHWCLRGSKRWVHWDAGRAGTGGVIEMHGPQDQWHPVEETFTLPADTTPGYGGSRSVSLVEDWLASIGGAGPCRNTPATTVAVLELIDTIYQASSEGRRIECSIGAGCPWTRRITQLLNPNCCAR